MIAAGADFNRAGEVARDVGLSNWIIAPGKALAANLAGVGDSVGIAVGFCAAGDFVGVANSVAVAILAEDVAAEIVDRAGEIRRSVQTETRADHIERARAVVGERRVGRSVRLDGAARDRERFVGLRVPEQRAAADSRAVALEHALLERTTEGARIDRAALLSGVVEEGAVAHRRRAAFQQQCAADKPVERSSSRCSVAEGEAVDDAAVRKRASQRKDRTACTEASARSRNRRHACAAERDEVDQLRVNHDRSVVRTWGNKHGRATRGRRQRALNRRVARAADDVLACAAVGNSVAVEIGHRSRRDVAGVRLSVCVAVRNRTRGDLARVELAVCVAVHLLATQEITRVGNAVAVAVGGRSIGDFAGVDRAVAVAIGAAAGANHRVRAARRNVGGVADGRRNARLSEGVPTPRPHRAIRQEGECVLA